MINIPKLDVVVGRQVQSADLTPSNTNFVMDRGIILAIYNLYVLINPNINDSLSLIGAKIIHVREETTSVTLEFDSNVKMVIDFCDEGYSSPEAMQLAVPGMPIVIWNYLLP